MAKGQGLVNFGGTWYVLNAAGNPVTTTHVLRAAAPRRPAASVATERPALHGWIRLALRLVGGGLLIAAGAIHLDLYLTGYRSIPTIGWLFLLQVIAAFGLGVARAAIRRVASPRPQAQDLRWPPWAATS